MLAGHVDINRQEIQAWLREMADRLDLMLKTHGRYPCIFTNYRDLINHPRQRNDEYRKEATAGSILVPLIASFLSALGDTASTEKLVQLKNKELSHCTLQVWLPDTSSEEKLYVGGTDHGIALCDLHLSISCKEMLETIKDACDKSGDFFGLSTSKTGYWPIILAACRHYRLPIPPQFWLPLVFSAATEQKSAV
jgi:hypothetical protein